MTTTPIETNTPEHDERLRREAAIAEQAREQRSASAKAKREAKAKPAPVAKPVAKKEDSMAEFVDNLLLGGVKWHYLETRVKAEAARRGVKTFASLGQIKAHVKYRSTQAKFKVTDVKGMVKMVLVEKKKPTPKAKATKTA